MDQGGKRTSMTKREGAVLSAYTGILLCESFDNVHGYITEIMGHPVFTHEIPFLEKEIKKRSEAEFKEIIKNQQ